MIDLDDPTYLRIRRNNVRLKWATATAIVVLATANLISILGA